MCVDVTLCTHSLRCAHVLVYDCATRVCHHNGPAFAVKCGSHYCSSVIHRRQPSRWKHGKRFTSIKEVSPKLMCPTRVLSNLSPSGSSSEKGLLAEWKRSARTLCIVVLRSVVNAVCRTVACRPDDDETVFCSMSTNFARSSSTRQASDR